MRWPTGWTPCTRIVIAIAVALTAAPVAAAPPPKPAPPLAKASDDLDVDGRREQIVLEADGALRIVDGSGRELARAQLTRSTAGGITIVANESGTMRRLLHAWVRSDVGRDEVIAAYADGKLEVLAREKTGPLAGGDRAMVIGLNATGIFRWQTTPTVARCDGETRLFLERFDATTRRFVPLETPLPKIAPTEIAAANTPPPGLPQWPRGAFHPVAASTDASSADERRADLLAAPTELGDREARTVWRAAGPGRGRGEWVTSRATDTNRRVVAVRMALALGAPPRRLGLMFSSGRAGDTTKPTLLAVTPPSAGGTLWVVPSQPIRAGCVSVIVVEPPAEGPTLIGELSIFTDVDGTDALTALIADTAGDGPGAEASERLLAAERTPGAAARVAEALATAVGGGRRRLLRVLTEQREKSTAPALGRALTIAAKDERQLVVRALVRLGPAGLDEAAKLIGDRAVPEEARADACDVVSIAASALSATPEAQRALVALVAAAGIGGESLFRARRGALVALARSHPSRLDDLVAAVEKSTAAGDLARALAAAAREAPAPAQRRVAAAITAALTSVVVVVEGQPPLAGARLDSALQLAGALRDLPAPEATALLDRLRADAKTPVPLRRAVTAALASLPRTGDDGKTRLALLRNAASDGDPGVRRTALMGLGAARDTETMTRALKSDGWPLVRRTAAELLAEACSPATESVLTEVLGGNEPNDSSEEVLRAAVVSLGRCAPQSRALIPILEGKGQPISVRTTAAALVARGAPPGAAAALARVLKLVLSDPRIADRGSSLAVACARGLGRLSDRSMPVLEAIGEAINDGTLPQVRAAGFEALGFLCPPEAPPAFARGATDPEAAVRRAAAAAQQRCAKK